MDQESEVGVCPSCGYPAHAGHGPQCAMVQPGEAAEKEPPLTISRVRPDDHQGVEEFLRFEVDQGFTTMVGSQTFEQKLALRQGQVNADTLRVATAKEGDDVVATSEIVLVNGTKGKVVKEDEAWASGTLVAPQKRGAGIGEKMAAWQDEMARDAGKKFILTDIAQKNYPSLRLRMKVGYEIEDMVGDPSAGETDFTLRNRRKPRIGPKKCSMAGWQFTTEQSPSKLPNNCWLTPKTQIKFASYCRAVIVVNFSCALKILPRRK